MHAMIRSYSGAGATELFDLLSERKAEVEEILRDVPGLVSYALMRTSDGGATVTICQDSSGTEESLKRAKAWLQENAAHLGTPPQVQEGPVELQFSV